MTANTPSLSLPVLIETNELDKQINQANLVLVDVRKEDQYNAGHLPGAMRLDYAAIVRQAPPVGGLLG